MANKITLYKNTDRILTFTWPTGTDLDGDTILFTMKKKVGGSEDDSDAIITGETTISTSTNQAQISLTDSDTNVALGDYVADIVRVKGSGDITGYSNFDIEVKNTVTQRRS